MSKKQQKKSSKPSGRVSHGAYDAHPVSGKSSVRDAQSEEGPDKHSGVTHPVASKVVDAVQDPTAHEAAKKARFASTGEPPKAPCALSKESACGARQQPN